MGIDGVGRGVISQGEVGHEGGLVWVSRFRDANGVRGPVRLLSDGEIATGIRASSDRGVINASQHFRGIRGVPHGSEAVSADVVVKGAAVGETAPGIDPDAGAVVLHTE